MGLNQGVSPASGVGGSAILVHLDLRIVRTRDFHVLYVPPLFDGNNWPCVHPGLVSGVTW